MELTHKTTILLSKALHRQLTELARERGQSLGELVRQACERQYGNRYVGHHLAVIARPQGGVAIQPLDGFAPAGRSQ
jgi:hypothetical protein